MVSERIQLPGKVPGERELDAEGVLAVMTSASPRGGTQGTFEKSPAVLDLRVQEL